jgi:hypothetical protein
MSAKCCFTAAPIGTVRNVTPSASANFSAFDRVRPLVPKPGIVTANAIDLGNPARSNPFNITSRASVESNPPDKPITADFARAATNLRASPVD